jgi:putative oxidoreductase
MKSLGLFKDVLTHPYLVLAVRLYIGGLFIYASMYKINYAGEFAETIASYQLAPYWAVNLMALVMPWAELICGLFLVIGFRTKSAAAVIIGLLALFSVAIAISLIRDLPIGCGCFHALGEQMSWKTLMRDVVWLLMAFYVYAFDSAMQIEKNFFLSVREL